MSSSVCGERDLSHDKPTAPHAVARGAVGRPVPAGSVVVPVAVVGGVPMAVVQIVDVTVVSHGGVTAAGAVGVRVILVFRADIGHARPF